MLWTCPALVQELTLTPEGSDVWRLVNTLPGKIQCTPGWEGVDRCRAFACNCEPCACLKSGGKKKKKSEEVQIVPMHVDCQQLKVGKCIG